MRWVAAVLVLLLGVCLWLTPLMSRRTVPLGVSVPSSKIDHPVVQGAILRFRAAAGVLSVLAAVAVLLLGGSDPVMAIAPLVLVALTVTAFIWARRPILQAKAKQGWFDQTPVRLQASVTPADQGGRWMSRVEFGWYAVSLVLLLGTAVVGAIRYDGLPDRIPTHFTFAGTPDQYSGKSVLSVFAPLLIGVGVIVLFVAVAGFTYVARTRQFADGDPGTAADRARRMRAFVARLLGVLALLISGLTSAASLAIYLEVTSWALTPVLVTGLVLIGAAVVWAVAESIRLQRPPTPSGERRAESPDDDRYWKGGLVYVNRNDPALFVPKRQGVGYTVNLGHRSGQVVTAVVGLFVVVSIVTSVIGSS